MRELDRPPLGGGENVNYFVEYEAQQALMRVSNGSEVNETLRHYYDYTGFTDRDKGILRKRTPFEQYEFSRKAAESGLAVLPPLAIVGNKVLYPFLEQTQTLMEYLSNGDEGHTAILPAIFYDMREAHRLGFIYGDRNAENILVGVGTSHYFTHIDFDLSISGKTAREFEVAELSMHALNYAGGNSLPILASALGTMCAQTPRWIDLDRTASYMRRMGEMLYTDLGADISILANQELLAKSTKAIRDMNRG